MESIIKSDMKGICYMCGKHCATEEHHVFYGTANRKLSEKYGLKVHLCHNCHNEPPRGVHYNKRNDEILKRHIQFKAMEYYNWTVEDFIKKFGRNYI